MNRTARRYLLVACCAAGLTACDLRTILWAPPVKSEYVSVQLANAPDGGAFAASTARDTVVDVLVADTLPLSAWSCVANDVSNVPRANCKAVEAEWYWSALRPAVVGRRHVLPLRVADGLSETGAASVTLGWRSVLATAPNHRPGSLTLNIYPWRSVRLAVESLQVRLGETVILPYVAENRDGATVTSLSALPMLSHLTPLAPQRTTSVIQRGTTYRVGEFSTWADTTYVEGIRVGMDTLVFAAAGRRLSVRVRVVP
jgi:hypothetical protein